MLDHPAMLRRGAVAVCALLAAGLATSDGMAQDVRELPDGSHELVLYDDIKEINPVLDKFKAYYQEKYGAPVEIRYFSQPGEELVLTLELEARANAVKADAVIMHHSVIKNFQEKYDLFEAPLQIEGRDDPAIAERLRDPVGDQSGVPALAGVYLIVYNSDLVSPEEAPRSWEDLLDERWTNKIGIGDPEVTGGALGPLWFITQHLGQEKGSPYGWEWYERLSALNPYLASSHNTLMEMVVSGELLVSINSLSSALTKAYSGDPIAAVMPEEGAALTTQTVAVIADKDGRDTARAFAEWTISQEGAQAFVTHKNGMPFRTDVKGEDYPFEFEFDPATLVQVDSDWVGGNRAEYIQDFRRAMGK